MPVSQILQVKGRSVVTASAKARVSEIAGLLAEKRIGAVVITDAHGHIEGIVSERDVVRHIAKSGAKALDMAASAIMTKDVRTCRDSDSEEVLMALMTTHRIRHVPVVTGGKLAGMISIGDVVKHRIEAIEREAEEMKAYIASAG